jgi:hypothetical protein
MNPETSETQASYKQVGSIDPRKQKMGDPQTCTHACAWTRKTIFKGPAEYGYITGMRILFVATK